MPVPLSCYFYVAFSRRMRYTETYVWVLDSLLDKSSDFMASSLRLGNCGGYFPTIL